MTDSNAPQGQPADLFDYNYKNVVISGLPGCGSTTLLNGLREILKMDGWRGFSGGEFMRAYATEKGLWSEDNTLHHNANIFTDEFENEVDFGMRQKLHSEEHWIIESWLAGFLAQQVPDVMKVLMTCSSDEVRIDRIVNRDQVSIEEAKQNAIERYNKNLTKWQRMYAKEWQEWVVDKGTLSAEDPIDFWNPALYDLVIDTYGMNKKQVFESAMNVLVNK
ncbi:MAG: AAA family ATPase [Pseudomonadales bacterium]|jgi:cytidylate kinase|nr:AAA family ATPase [Pseudomonadales bacterium]